MTKLSAREKLTISAALQWFLECVNSSEPYDMSHLTFGDDPLSDDEIKSLCKCLRESPADDYQSTLTTGELESIGQVLDDAHYEYASYLGYATRRGTTARNGQRFPKLRPRQCAPSRGSPDRWGSTARRNAGKSWLPNTRAKKVHRRLSRERSPTGGQSPLVERDPAKNRNT